MPFYEYQCDACGHEFEAMQKMSDAPLTDCPSCTEAELVKKVSAAGFRLKGGGWYETDFKKGGKKNVGDKPNAGDSEKKPAARKREGQVASAGASSACN